MQTQSKAMSKAQLAARLGVFLLLSVVSATLMLTSNPATFDGADLLAVIVFSLALAYYSKAIDPS